MAWVKGLERVSAIDEPFAGFYQRTKYVIDGAPLPPIAPRAVLVEPADGEEIAPWRERGQAWRIAVRGYAWSGSAELARVEIGSRPTSSGRERHWGAGKLRAPTVRPAWRGIVLDLPPADVSAL